MKNILIALALMYSLSGCSGREDKASVGQEKSDKKKSKTDSMSAYCSKWGALWYISKA